MLIADFNMSEQDNFRIIWNVNDSERSLVDYTQFTFPSPYEYFNLTVIVRIHYRQIIKRC